MVGAFPDVFAISRKPILVARKPFIGMEIWFWHEQQQQQQHRCVQPARNPGACRGRSLSAVPGAGFLGRNNYFVSLGTPYRTRLVL